MRMSSRFVVGTLKSHRRADNGPRQLEHADHVVGIGLHGGPVRQPRRQAERGPDQRAGDTDDDAVDPHDETDVPVGGAQRAEHPERAQPALRQHREPPALTRAMSSIATVTSASTMVSGLSGLPAAAEETLCTFRPIELGVTPGALNRTVTWVGARTWPGTTRANSASRLCGFSTMPTTRRAWPACCQTSPTLRPKVAAAPGVTATWPALAG